MAALTLVSPVANRFSGKTLGNQGKSSDVNSYFLKPNLTVNKTSSKRWQSMCNGRRLVAQIHCSASLQVICSAVLRARCSTEQQTIQHQSAVISKAPVQGKEKTPELDDGGTGGGPGRDDGGGGGGGGWGGWSGGFFLFGFLAFLGFLQDRENEGPYADDRKMKRQAQRY